MISLGPTPDGFLTCERLWRIWHLILGSGFVQLHARGSIVYWLIFLLSGGWSTGLVGARPYLRDAEAARSPTPSSR